MNMTATDWNTTLTFLIAGVGFALSLLMLFLVARAALRAVLKLRRHYHERTRTDVQ